MRWYLLWVSALIAVLFAIGCGGSGSSITPSSSRWTIGAAGGTFQTAANEVHLVVPAGALGADTLVTAQKLTTAPTPPAGKTYVAGSAWSFTHVTFTTDSTLTLGFPAATPTGSLKIYRRTDGASEWTPVATTVNAAEHTASAQISSFSSYGLFFEAGTGWNWTSAGGTFISETLTVTLPAAAVTTPVEVQARRTPSPFTPPAGWTAVTGATFDLGSSDTSLTTSSPFTVSIVYEAGNLPVALRDNAKIFYKENAESVWSMLTSTSVAANLKVSAPSTTLGTFAVFYPTPVQPSVYWVEQRSIVNDIFLDIYTAAFGGSETLAYSPAQMQGMSQLRTNTYRWSDKSYLGLEFADATHTYLMSYNVQTNVSTRLFLLARDPGYIFGSVEPVRANRIAGTDDYALQISVRNPDTGLARDQLVVFRDGSSTPQVLLTNDRTDGEGPAIMRPWDISANGRVLALTADGLVMFTGTSQTILASADLGPGEAYFSPTGDRVLYKRFGEDSGWRVRTLATTEDVAIAGTDVGTMVRWANDDNHLIKAVTSGPDRRIDLIDVATGTPTNITTAGAHATSFINDIGIR